MLATTQGACVWFVVAREYASKLDKLVAGMGIDSLRDSWWPKLEDLEAAGIPYERFVQEAG